MGTAAVQRGLFGEDYAAEDVQSVGTDWRTKAEALRKLGESRGGLIPRAALHTILGISRQRVHQLIEDGAFEEVLFGSVSFVSGRSVDAWEKEKAEKDSEGGWRGRPRANLFTRTKVSLQLGTAIGDAIFAE